MALMQMLEKPSYRLYFEVKHTLTQKVGDMKDAGCPGPPLSRPERGVLAVLAVLAVLVCLCSHRDCGEISREEPPRRSGSRPGRALRPGAACRPSPGRTSRLSPVSGLSTSPSPAGERPC